MGLIFSNFFCKINIVCYSSTHLIMLAMSLVTFVIMVVLDLLYGFFFFNFTFKNVDTLSKNPSKINLAFFVFRIVSLGTYLIVDLNGSTGFIELLLV